MSFDLSSVDPERGVTAALMDLAVTSPPVTQETELALYRISGSWPVNLVSDPESLPTGEEPVDLWHTAPTGAIQRARLLRFGITELVVDWLQSSGNYGVVIRSPDLDPEKLTELAIPVLRIWYPARP